MGLLVIVRFEERQSDTSDGGTVDVEYESFNVSLFSNCLTRSFSSVKSIKTSFLTVFSGRLPCSLSTLSDMFNLGMMVCLPPSTDDL